MKRVGHIFERVLERDNLMLAFWKASKGKRTRGDQRAFAERLDENLEKLRSGLENGDYPVGRYHRFTIHDPKERGICAAVFGERVLHHAFMNVCEPHFERWLVNETHACRKERGQKSAVAAACENARRFRWYLKCDVRKYFDSISHDRLRLLLASKFKDPHVLGWFGRLIGTYETSPGRGLPIGNLTSQHFANLYLDRLDRFVLNRCETGRKVSIGYVRYMDDFIVWCDDRDVLLDFRSRIGELLTRELSLEFKLMPMLQRASAGMDFLGLRILPRSARASRASLRRYSRKERFYEWLHGRGAWDDEELQRRMTALTAFLQQGETLAWRRRRLTISGFGEKLRVRTASYAAAAGTTMPTTAVPRTATTTTRRTRTTTTASASVAPQHHPARRMVPADVQSARIARGEYTCHAAAGRPVDAGFERRGGAPGGRPLPNGAPGGRPLPNGAPGGCVAYGGAPGGCVASNGAPGGRPLPNGAPGGRPLPCRKAMDHRGPLNIDVTGAWYFITICAEGHDRWMVGGDPRAPRDASCHEMPLDDAANVILNESREYHVRGIWRLALFLVMPDHLHFIVHGTTGGDVVYGGAPGGCVASNGAPGGDVVYGGAPGGRPLPNGAPGGRPLPKMIGDFKRMLTNRYGLRFQRDFWDTRIRDDAHFAEKFRYVCNNPVRKGLCAVVRDWPYVMAFDRETGEGRQHR